MLMRFHHSADTNDQRSPLLALPAEIKLEIFEYVLGGLTIEAAYVARKGRLFRTRFCTSPDGCPLASLLSPPGALRFCDNHPLGEEATAEAQISSPGRHDECQPAFSTSPARLNLDLLRVCRRIYSEAALLPFQKNTFVIHTAKGFVYFGCPALQGFLDSLGARTAGGLGSRRRRRRRPLLEIPQGPNRSAQGASVLTHRPKTLAWSRVDVRRPCLELGERGRTPEGGAALGTGAFAICAGFDGGAVVE